MIEDYSLDVNQLCRICSSALKGRGIGIFSRECMDNLVGEKIRRYLYFSVSIKDSLPKMVCRNCLRKLESIHKFAKMAAEMQEKFRMLLTAKSDKPKIKIKTLDDINKEVIKTVVENDERGGNIKIKTEPQNIDINLDTVVEEVGDVVQEEKIIETTTKADKIKGQPKVAVKERKKKIEKMEKPEKIVKMEKMEIIEKCDKPIKIERNDEIETNEKAEQKEENMESMEIMDFVNGTIKLEENRRMSIEEDNEADTSDSDRLVIQDDEKQNPSLLHCLLVKGKQKMSMDIDHDYLVKVKDEVDIKEEPADPEDEDIAEEIAEDRLNQIIKDQMGSDSEHESEDDKNSDLEITEMEVKVDPTLYFSNASQSGNEIEQDSQDGQDVLTIVDVSCTNSNNSSNNMVTTKTVTVAGTGKTPQQKNNASTEKNPLVMTRLQQKMNPVIASLKLGKPYKCTLCPRSFITDIGLQNHLWSHLPKTRKSQSKDGILIPKNIDLEESQVYSSNGVLHTAQPSENPNLLKYVCPICGKKISTKGNLKVHLETHRPKGKYGCDICGRVFKTAANLFRHKDYHGGVQFPCPVCGRVYPTNSTLRAHSITHSDLRPHKCPLCSKTFKRNQDLKFHINQHTGARPYQCPYCPKAFASSGNCFSHRKRMHPLEVERDKERAAEIMG